MAMYFRGDSPHGDNLQASGAATNFEYTDAFSGSCWFYMNFEPGAGVLFGNAGAAGTNFKGWHFEYRYSPQRLGFWLISSYPSAYAAVDGPVTGTSGYVANVWYHVGFTYNGSGLASGINLYQFGKNSNSLTTSDTLAGNSTTTSENFFIGDRADLVTEIWGRIGEVAVWRGVLTASEMAALSTGNVWPRNIRPQRLVHYFPLNEPGRVAVNHGTLSKVPALATGASFLPGPPVTYPQFRTSTPTLIKLPPPKVLGMTKPPPPTFVTSYQRTVNINMTGP